MEPISGKLTPRQNCKWYCQWMNTDTGEHLMISDGWYSAWPFLYNDDSMGVDNASYLPKYIKEFAHKLLLKKKYGEIND